MRSPYRNPWKGSPWARSVPDAKAARYRRVMLSLAVASSGAIAAVIIAMAAGASQGL